MEIKRRKSNLQKNGCFIVIDLLDKFLQNVEHGIHLADIKPGNALYTTKKGKIEGKFCDVAISVILSPVYSPENWTKLLHFINKKMVFTYMFSYWGLQCWLEQRAYQLEQVESRLTPEQKEEQYYFLLEHLKVLQEVVLGLTLFQIYTSEPPYKLVWVTVGQRECHQVPDLAGGLADGIEDTLGSQEFDTELLEAILSMTYLKQEDRPTLKALREQVNKFKEELINPEDF